MGKINTGAAIIIRGKNESRWLKILLNTLKNQNYKNFEIIFCDNLSSDNTLNILKYYKVKKIVKIDKFYPGKAINLALKKTKKKYSVILSSHCIPVNNSWLQDFVNYMDNNSEIVAAYGKQLPTPGTSSMNSVDLNILFKNEEIKYYKDPYITNANAIYRNSYLKKNLFNEKLTNIEDQIWAKKASKENKIISYTAGSDVFHSHGIHQHEHSSDRSIKTEKIIKSNSYLHKIWEKHPLFNSKFYNYSLIINARRENNVINIKKILHKFFNSRLNKELKFYKIFIITDYNFTISNNKIQFVKPSNSLEEDLKNIYKKFYKDWILVNYIVAINSKGRINFINIKKLINEGVKQLVSSISFAKIFDGNFILDFPEGGSFVNLKLNIKEQKPLLKLMTWSDGCMFDPDNLRKGLYVDKNSNLLITK